MPASSSILAPLILRALEAEGGPMRRRDLIGRVALLARSQGFALNGDTQGISAMKKALQRLSVRGKSSIHSRSGGSLRLTATPTFRFLQIQTCKNQISTG